MAGPTSCPIFACDKSYLLGGKRVVDCSFFSFRVNFRVANKYTLIDDMVDHLRANGRPLAIYVTFVGSRSYTPCSFVIVKSKFILSK